MTNLLEPNTVNIKDTKSTFSKRNNHSKWSTIT